jgi:SAM-dependent methyltransferase
MLSNTVTDEPVTTERGYAYVGRAPLPPKVVNREGAQELGQSILNPGLRDPDYLVRCSRRKILENWFAQLPERELAVLDIGGRLQPYRPLLGKRAGHYVALDPVFEGLLDVAGVGEHLPFRDGNFDLALCTQTLNYASSPAQVVDEIHRVLKPGGTVVLTAAAIFPRLHDLRWQFMPDGLQLLLKNFTEIELVPEDRSIAGLCRSINWFFESFLRSERLRRYAGMLLYPVFNLAGVWLDRFSRGKSKFATNYACRARKPAATQPATHKERKKDRRRHAERRTPAAGHCE